MRQFLIVFAWSAVAAFANAADVSLVGKQVIVTDYGSNLMVDGKVVGAAAKHGIYQVEQVQGEWLWIASQAAYLHRKDVVPLDEAIGYFSRQIEIRPSTHLLEWRAVIWERQGEYEKAIEDINEALLYLPTESTLYARRAYLRYRLEDFDSAIADCNEAIRFEPANARAYYVRGCARMGKRLYGLASKDLTEAIEFADPLGLCEASKIIGQPRYQQTVRAPMYHGRALVRRAAQKFESAVADEEEAIKLDPAYVDAYCSASEMLVTCPEPRLRDAVRAAKLALTACELTGWKEARSIDTLAAAYAELGDYEEAIATEEKAIGLADWERKSLYERHREFYRECKDKQLDFPDWPSPRLSKVP